METVNDITSEPMEILFVDDEINVLQSLKRLFIDEEYRINIASSGQEGLDILKDNPNVGLIVSDQRMPVMTGVDFLEKAKEILPDALRILLTGYADINAVADAINRGGAYRYITKPWKDDDLLQVISEASQRYSLIRENKRLQDIVKEQNEELKNWNSQLEYYVQEQTLEIQKNNDVLQGLNKNLKSGFKNMILAFSNLLALKDIGSRNHSKNVAEISVKIAKALKLESSDVESIAVASLLHDIGKIGMPDVLLLRSEGEMSEDEKQEYIQHPVRGQTAIDSVQDLRNPGVLIRHHHEWFNGTGFPDGLSGDTIPAGARIIAIADYFDRTISKLSSKDAIETALSKVKEQIGKRFDGNMYIALKPVVKEIYSRTFTRTGVHIVEKELSVDKVKAGMILSRDVKSGTGLMLISKGVKLNEHNIQALNRYCKLDPSKTGVFIMTEVK